MTCPLPLISSIKGLSNLRKTKRDKIEKRNDKFLRNLDGQNPVFFLLATGGNMSKKGVFSSF